MSSPESRHRDSWIKIPLLGVTAFLVYLLSSGPIAWATNDGRHPRYLPEAVNIIYVPLTPFLEMPFFHDAWYWYTVLLWGGFPAGYTTL